MELGEKLRSARQEAGLSQRQLCGDIITRNMLSQIEHGTARPSMDTLRALALRLEKPVSFFLEEDAAISPNKALMEQARKADPAQGWKILKEFQHPDPVLEWEWKYRSCLAGLETAKQALEEGKHLYARQLLEEAAEFDHGIPELERRRLLLLAKIPGTDLADIIPRLPSLDEELLLRAEAALAGKDSDRAMELLSAMDDREDPRRNLLMGQSQMEKKEYAAAAECLEKAQNAYPQPCLPLLEICFRELGDYKKAYEYACKQR